jgi:hypothetical protein
VEAPEGTIAEVLAWVGNDPERAQAALDAEYDGANRSTLITQLEAIAAKEASMSTEPETDEAPAPEPSVEIELYPGDSGTVVGPVSVRDADVEAEDITIDIDVDQAIDAEQVESVQGISATNGAVLVLNGTAYAFNAQMVGAIKQAVDQAVVGLAL